MATITWQNPHGGDWAVGNNWHGKAVPGAADTAVIGGQLGPITSAVNETIASLTVTSKSFNLNVTGGDFTTTGLSNTGTIEVTGGVMDIGGGGNILTNNGTVSALGGSEVFHNTTVRQGTGGTLLADGATSTITLDSTTIDGGTLSTLNGGLVETGDLNSVLDGSTIFGAVTNAGSLQVNDGTGLTLNGSIINSGTITVNGTTNFTGQVVGAVPVNLSGGGQIVLAAKGYIGGAGGLTNVDNTISGGGFIKTITLTNGAAGVIDANNGRMVLNTGNTVTNAGTIEATGNGNLFIANTTIDSSSGGSIIDAGRIQLNGATLAGGSLSITKGSVLQSSLQAGVINLAGGTVANSGMITGTGGGLTIVGDVANGGNVEAVNGDLTIIGALAGTGTAKLFGSGILEVDGALTENAAFSGTSTGALVLGDATGFSGRLAGLSHTGANSIDLKNVAYDATDSLTYVGSKVGGTLTLSDSSSNVLATIKLVGDYVTSGSFSFSSDGGTGTRIIDPPKAAALVSAIASFGATGASSASHTAIMTPAPHMLAMSHAA